MSRVRDIANILSGGSSAIATDAEVTSATAYIPANVAGKNVIINGGMDIWQRGVSFTNPGSTYTVDRWNGYWSANGTVTQETTNVPPGSRYALKMTATANSAGNNFYQMIETSNTVPLAGKVVTFSVYVAGTAGKTPIIGIDTSTVVDDSLFGSWTALATSSSVTTTTTYQRVSVTATIPSTAKSIRVHMDSYPVNNTDYMLWGGAQLELGSVATSFSRAGGDIQGELAKCQRYYQVLGDNIYELIYGGYMTSGTTGYISFPYPVTMRTTPTGTLVGGWAIFNTGQPIIQSTHPKSISLRVASTTTGQFYFHSNTTYYLTMSAEL